LNPFSASVSPRQSTMAIFRVRSEAAGAEVHGAASDSSSTDSSGARR
jgi:hypothetical protein